MQWTNDARRAFRLKLATLYPGERDARALLEDARLNVAYIDLSGSPVSRWYEALTEANKHPGKLNQILALAHERYADDPLLADMARGNFSDITPPTVSNWRGGAPAFEKIIGTESTLVPVSFLERGLERARAVARVRVPGGYGTGFLIREDLLLTNNHVIATPDAARGSFADFNYQRTLAGELAGALSLALSPDIAFATSVEHDWTVVGVEGRPGESHGTIRMRQVGVMQNEFVQIIQHPQGGEKQIAYRMNVVAYADAEVVQYLTDTLPGSSGSPVFNRDWQLVALHHSGGLLAEPTNPGGRFLRNEGIYVNTLITDLRSRGILPTDS